MNIINFVLLVLSLSFIVSIWVILIRQYKSDMRKLKGGKVNEIK